MEEQWKSVVGYEGLYEVSNLGQVKSLKRNGKIIKPFITKNGYLNIKLRLNNKSYHKYIHRLVIEAFNFTEDKTLDCDHIDRNRLNNNLNNLRWANRSQNCLNTNRRKSKFLRGVYIHKRPYKKKDGTIVFHKYTLPYFSKLTTYKKSVYLGSYKTEEEAHEAYKQAFKKYHGYEWMG